VTLKAPDRHPSRQQLKHCYVLKAQHNWSLQYEAFFSSHLLVVFFYQNVHIANSAIVELKAITRNYIKDFEKSTDRQMKHSLVQNLKTCSFFLIPAVKPRYLIRTIRVALTLAKSWLRIVAVYNPNTLLHPINPISCKCDNVQNGIANIKYGRLQSEQNTKNVRIMRRLSLKNNKICCIGE